MKIYTQQFWFITGSQHLYGPETLAQVKQNSQVVSAGLAASEHLPAELVFKGLVTTPAEIKALMTAASVDPNCAGIITWCHTFSPSKMWINGINALNKPWLHLHTQFNKAIPIDTIDMDFMNLNQAAHGDREHAFIATRMGKARKIVVGHWDSERVKSQIGGWMRSAMGALVSRNLNVVRIGDNMREVAVTEGDKVATQIKLGWAVNTHGIGDVVALMTTITEADIDAKMADYQTNYILATDKLTHVRHQAHLQLAMEKLFNQENAMAFSTNFQDLHGVEQLPGLASQDLMAQGYGFAGEGDWKTAALTHIMKAMAKGLPKGTSFMEDYTYHFEEGNDLVLGSHMLEICPTIADKQAAIQVHPLGIGGKNDPARLVFPAKAGEAIVVTLVDMGGRLRMIINDITCVTPPDMPNLPVASALWKPAPNLEVSAHAWMLAGGAHHSVLSYDLTAEHLLDWAEIMDIECVHINADSTVNGIKQELFFADIAWRLRTC